MKSRQECVPYILQHIDLGRVDPLHIMNNIGQHWYKELLGHIMRQSPLSKNPTVANMGPSFLKSHLDLLRECKQGKLSYKVIKSLKENSFQNVPTMWVTGKQTKLLCKWCIKLIQASLTGNDQIDLKLYYLVYIAHDGTGNITVY